MSQTGPFIPPERRITAGEIFTFHHPISFPIDESEQPPARVRVACWVDGRPVYDATVALDVYIWQEYGEIRYRQEPAPEHSHGHPHEH